MASMVYPATTTFHPPLPRRNLSQYVLNLTPEPPSLMPVSCRHRGASDDAEADNDAGYGMVFFVDFCIVTSMSLC